MNCNIGNQSKQYLGYRLKKIDTLVADCEGALQQSLKDEPDFLEIFETITMEKDYYDIEHKKFVDVEFKI